MSYNSVLYNITRTFFLTRKDLNLDCNDEVSFRVSDVIFHQWVFFFSLVKDKKNESASR